MIKIYLDEDAESNRLLQALIGNGVDVTSTLNEAMLAKTDEQQLVWASLNQRVLYSFNARDFYRIHTDWLSSGKSHAGIVLGKQTFSTGDQLRGLLKLSNEKSMMTMKDSVDFLGRWIS